MSNSMFAEILENSSGSSKRVHRRMWKNPIRISRSPTESDFTVDQIPVIFSGYTAESDDSSSPELSDDSKTDDNEEIDQETSKTVRIRSNLKKLKSISRISSMRVLRRQSTRKLTGGQRLMKMRSMKRLASISRRIPRKKNLDSISSADLVLLEPHYLRPTSSSASKDVGNTRKNLGVARLKRISSLRYNGLLKATCSSAMKGSSSKTSNDVCTYRYCSLHGQPHSHGADNNVTVPSLKRFVSMRRKFLKRQKSVNRRLVLLKRTLSWKRGPLGGGIMTDRESKQVDSNADGESNQEVFEEEVSSSENDGNDFESIGRSTDTVMIDVDDNGDGGVESMETVESARKQSVEESNPETMDDSDGTNDNDLKKITAQWHEISEQTVTDLDQGDGKVEEMKNEETVEDNRKVGKEDSSGEIREEDRKEIKNVWNDKESKRDTHDDSYGRIAKDFEESNVTGLCYDNGEVERTKKEEIVEENEEVCRKQDEKNTENVWNDTVTLVKQAFDEILAEITDDDVSDDTSMTKDETLEGESAKEYDVGADLSDSSSSDMQPIERRDTNLSVIVSNSLMGEESNHHRGIKKWAYLKRVVLLKRFLKSLDQREKRKMSDGEESETLRLRRELVGEKKNAEEWMLDHALRQVISTLAPSQKRKVKHLVKAFESLIPMDGGSRGHDDLESNDSEKNETMNSQMILRDNKDTTDLLEVLQGKILEKTKLTSEASSSLPIGMISEEALESVADASLCHHLAVKDEIDGSASGSSIEEEEKTIDSERIGSASGSSIEEEEEKTRDSERIGSASGSSIEEEEKTRDSERKNLSTWRNLIQKHMVMRDKSERKHEEAEKEHKWFDGTNERTSTKEDGDAAAIKSFQQAFEKILSEIPDPSFDEEIVSESSNSLKEKKEDQGETKKSWNSLRKNMLLRKFVKSLEKVQAVNLRKLRNLPVESELEAENVFLRHLPTMERRRYGEELMLDYALRQAISRLAPIQRKKVELLVQAFDTVIDGHENLKQTKTSDTPLSKDKPGEGTPPRVEEDCEVNKDEQRIKNVFSRFQVHQKDLKGENDDASTPKESRNLPPIRNVKQGNIAEKDSRLWKLIYKHMVTEKEGADTEYVESLPIFEGKCDDEADSIQIDTRRSDTVTLVREALEKILSEIPDNSSDDQSMSSDITTDQELFERNSQVSTEEAITFKPKSNEKRVKGWNNVKKVILLKRFVSDLGSLTRLSPKTPRVLPWEPDPETEKIRLRHQSIGDKRNPEEWMLDYALRQAISTLAPSQKRKVSLLAQAFDTISLQDIGSSSTPGSMNISRQSSLSSLTVHSENEGNAETLRGKLRNLQEDLKLNTKLDGTASDLEEKQQCSSLWRLLCKQMEDNERNQTLPEQTIKEEQEEKEEEKEDTNMDDEKMEVYQTEAVELLGEVIDGISVEESQAQNLETRQNTETVQVSQVKINRWSNLKRVILLRRFVKALENVRKFNPREPRFLPQNPETKPEEVNLRHQETKNKRNGDEWMVDNALQEVVSKLTPARKLKVQLLVQAFESISAK